MKTDMNSVRHVLLLAGGAIVSLVAVGLLAAGSVLLWADQAKPDAQGYFTTSTEVVRTPSHALVSEPLDMDLGDAPSWLADAGDLGTIRVRAASNDSAQGLFVGIARHRDVALYLADVEHEEVTEAGLDPLELDLEPRAGASTPAAPGTETFWTASTEGTGTQTLAWGVEDGDWAIVVMNADGSAGLDLDLSVGAKVPWLFEASLGTLAGGVLLLLGGGVLIYFGARDNRDGEQPPLAEPERALAA
jgi:hypothetical protein